MTESTDGESLGLGGQGKTCREGNIWFRIRAVKRSPAKIWGKGIPTETKRESRSEPGRGRILQEWKEDQHGGRATNMGDARWYERKLENWKGARSGRGP